MNVIEQMSHGGKCVIGMVHCLPMPGTLLYEDNFEETAAIALEDANRLEAAGFDAIMVENSNDGPAQLGMDSAQIAAMAVVCDRIVKAVRVPVGIDACGDSIAGISIAAAANLAFVRIPYFVDTVVSVRGITTPNAHEALMLRKKLNAKGVKIFADIHCKHTYPLSGLVTLENSAKWAEGALADAIIVTGEQTGAETPVENLRRVKAAVSIPVISGSGSTEGNIAEQFAVCDGTIVGSSIKKDNSLCTEVDPEQAKRFMEAANRSRRV